MTENALQGRLEAQRGDYVLELRPSRAGHKKISIFPAKFLNDHFTFLNYTKNSIYPPTFSNCLGIKKIQFSPQNFWMTILLFLNYTKNFYLSTYIFELPFSKSITHIQTNFEITLKLPGNDNSGPHLGLCHTTGPQGSISPDPLGHGQCFH